LALQPRTGSAAPWEALNSWEIVANMLVASGRNRQHLPHELPCHARLAEGGGLIFVNDQASLIVKSHS
jgi:hypothetical protein